MLMCTFAKLIYFSQGYVLQIAPNMRIIQKIVFSFQYPWLPEVHFSCFCVPALEKCWFVHRRSLRKLPQSADWQLERMQAKHNGLSIKINRWNDGVQKRYFAKQPVFQEYNLRDNKLFSIFSGNVRKKVLFFI